MVTAAPVASRTKRVCSPCLRGAHARCIASSCECLTCYPPDGAEPASPAAPETASVVVWEDPPRSRFGRARLEEEIGEAVLEQLRAHPGKWAKVRTWAVKSSASTAASRIRKGEAPGLPAVEWEAVGRSVPGGSALYLRYRGAPT